MEYSFFKKKRIMWSKKLVGWKKLKPFGLNYPREIFEPCLLLPVYPQFLCFPFKNFKCLFCLFVKVTFQLHFLKVF